MKLFNPNHLHYFQTRWNPLSWIETDMRAHKRVPFLLFCSPTIISNLIKHQQLKCQKVTSELIKQSLHGVGTKELVSLFHSSGLWPNAWHVLTAQHSVAPHHCLTDFRGHWHRIIRSARGLYGVLERFQWQCLVDIVFRCVRTFYVDYLIPDNLACWSDYKLADLDCKLADSQNLHRSIL